MGLRFYYRANNYKNLIGTYHHNMVRPQVAEGERLQDIGG
jgi:hypothetical protein